MTYRQRKRAGLVRPRAAKVPLARRRYIVGFVLDRVTTQAQTAKLFGVSQASVSRFLRDYQTPCD